MLGQFIFTQRDWRTEYDSNRTKKISFCTNVFERGKLVEMHVPVSETLKGLLLSYAAEILSPLPTPPLLPTFIVGKKKTVSPAFILVSFFRFQHMFPDGSTKTDEANVCRN